MSPNNGFRMFDADRSKALEALGRFVQGREKHYVCFCEANLLAHTTRNEQVLNALRRASLVMADGVGAKAYARLRGQSAVDRYPGPTFILDACEIGVEKGWRHFFYGGAPGVPERLARNLKQRFPGMQVAGTFSPPFTAVSDTVQRDIIGMIEATKPDLLWVGLGGPKQELWMAEHLGKIDVPVMLGVGAAFDFHSGKRPWAPPFIRKIGMEWAYRMLTGGKATFRRNLWCVSVVARLLLATWIRRYVFRQFPAKTKELLKGMEGKGTLGGPATGEMRGRLASDGVKP